MKLEHFWIVTYPTQCSGLEDICFECDVGGIFLQVHGGLKRSEIEGVYTTEQEAQAVAKALLSARDATPPPGKAGEEISTDDLVGLITDMLLSRQGETLSNAIAVERARNIATALAGVTVKP